MLPAESRVSSHHLLCGGVQIAGGGLPNLYLWICNPREVPSFLAQESGIWSSVFKDTSLLLAQGFP